MDITPSTSSLPIKGDDDVASLFGDLDTFLPDLQGGSECMESLFTELDAAIPSRADGVYEKQVSLSNLQQEQNLASARTPERSTPLGPPTPNKASCVSPQNHNRSMQSPAQIPNRIELKQVVFRNVSPTESAKQFQERHNHFCNLFRELDRQEAQGNMLRDGSNTTIEESAPSQPNSNLNGKRSLFSQQNSAHKRQHVIPRRHVPPKERMLN
jgi:hypothetical protein